MIAPHLAVILAATTVAGFLMVVSGLHKRALERRRRRPRFCPSCGRRLETCGCG
ncbi:MAG: hypothetical protein WBB74_10025 [Gaiellaceae bacterium]